MHKRIALYLAILIFLGSCTLSQSSAPVMSNGSAESLETRSDADALEQTPVPSTPIVNATTPPLPTRPATITLAPDKFKAEFPEPTLEFHPVVTPSAPLDPKSYLSILDWIKFNFANRDLSVIQELALDSVSFGISEAEYDSTLTRDELIKTLAAHLAPGTQCLAYTFRDGEIDSLEIFVANWEPGWVYAGRRTDDLILFFSDQFTPDSGLRLVAVPQALDQHYVNELYEVMCFE